MTRQLVGLLERDLCDKAALFAHFWNLTCVQRPAFNILLTPSHSNWDGACYVSDLITFLSPLVGSFIKEADCDSVTAHDGTGAETDAAEGKIFSCFADFYEDNQLCNLVMPSR
jgi:hypothetical protein